MIGRSDFTQLDCVEHECEYEMMPLWILLASLVATASVFAVVWLFSSHVLLFAWVFLVIFSGKVIKYRTDSNGLHIEGRTWYRYSWRRVIKWIDVADARLVNSKTGRILLVLNNGKRKTVTLGRVKQRFPEDNNAKMEASIYQHLRRAQAAANLKLRQDAESYFLDIPDQIPDTMSVVREENEFTVTYRVTPEMLEVKWIPTDEKSSDSDSYLKDTIEFSKARNCEWNPYIFDGFEFSIETKDADTIIKARGDETQMQTLVLAAVRQLRRNPKTDAIWLPQVLVDMIKSYDSRA